MNTGAVELYAPHLTSSQREEWQDLALCAQTDPDIFFPDKGGSTKEVKKICARCNVKAECLAYAMSAGTEDRFGMYGGLSPVERRALRKAIA